MSNRQAPKQASFMYLWAKHKGLNPHLSYSEDEVTVEWGRGDTFSTFSQDYENDGGYLSASKAAGPDYSVEFELGAPTWDYRDAFLSILSAERGEQYEPSDIDLAFRKYVIDLEEYLSHFSSREAGMIAHNLRLSVEEANGIGYK